MKEGAPAAGRETSPQGVNGCKRFNLREKPSGSKIEFDALARRQVYGEAANA
jgi:hypothetical protein